MNVSFKPLSFEKDSLVLLDQRKLPHSEVFISCNNLDEGFTAIKDMVVRGAPCIGFTAIYTLAIWLKANKDKPLENFIEAAEFLKSARPTAVNLGFEVDRVISLVKKNSSKSDELFEIVKQFGDAQVERSEVNNRKMAIIAEKELDASLGISKYQLLTHCNTGFLACGSIGTALGVVQHLHEQKKVENVWVDETRPYLQGSRLTAFELTKLGVNYKVVVEGAASYLMRNNLVDAIFVGADRVVANGDTANKVGTSNLAILANYYGIPFYVVAPTSSLDLAIQTGEDIEIELRPGDEILKINDQLIAPKNALALNPSFDITKGKLISGIVTEFGIAKGDYQSTLKGVAGE